MKRKEIEAQISKKDVKHMKVFTVSMGMASLYGGISRCSHCDKPIRYRVPEVVNNVLANKVENKTLSNVVFGKKSFKVHKKCQKAFIAKVLKYKKG